MSWPRLLKGKQVRLYQKFIFHDRPRLSKVGQVPSKLRSLSSEVIVLSCIFQPRHLGALPKNRQAQSASGGLEKPSPIWPARRFSPIISAALARARVACQSPLDQRARASADVPVTAVEAYCLCLAMFRSIRVRPRTRKRWK